MDGFHWNMGLILKSGPPVTWHFFDRTCNLADLVASLSHFLRENDGKPVDFGIQWDTPDTLFSDKPI